MCKKCFVENKYEQYKWLVIFSSVLYSLYCNCTLKLQALNQHRSVEFIPADQHFNNEDLSVHRYYVFNNKYNFIIIYFYFYYCFGSKES